MSQENVEVVRRVIEAFEAKDIDALVVEHHPDVEIVVLRSEIEGPYLGHEGLRRMAADMFEADFEMRIDEMRLRDAGQSRVGSRRIPSPPRLACGNQRGRPDGALACGLLSSETL